MPRIDEAFTKILYSWKFSCTLGKKKVGTWGRLTVFAARCVEHALPQ